MANIKVFARVKPCTNINQELFKHEDQALYISSHGQVETNAAISSRVAEDSTLRFKFSHVFGMDSSQKNVFEVAAKNIVEAFLEGYNGTIFAYGQTGAGKTFTIQGPEEEDVEGNWNASENTGLIPRSLSLIFQKLQHNHNEIINLHISFLEIYKETAYDLLGPLLFKGTRKLRELPKVLITIGGQGSCHLHGLSCHHVTSEAEAVRLYHLGLANRKNAETAVNHRSSRSHSIFTIALTKQRHGAEIIIRSKLHLVDLAGSEQVWKSCAGEQQLSKTKFLNMSLLHLESVIIALQKFSVRNLRNHGKRKQTAKCLNRSCSAILSGTKNTDAVQRPRPNALLKSASAVELGNQKGRHSLIVMENEPVQIPYRNSLLTMVLQDSLGGNCNAAMIAALSLEEKNLHETISTCRFAQRVARVINKPIRNEEVDKDVVIKRLQTTLAKLYLELSTYKASHQESMMVHCEDGNSFEHEQQCVAVMQSFLAGRISDPVAHGVNTPSKFRTTLRYLRQMLVESSPHHAEGGDEGLESADDSGVRTSSEPTSPLASEEENDHVHFVAHLPSPVSTTADVTEHRLSMTQDSEISLNTNHEEATPDQDSSLPGSYSSTVQPYGPGTSEPSTQTTVTSVEERKTKRGVCAEEEIIQPVARSHADLWIWELDLEKETLLNRSKMFASRLADQRARLVLMARQGAVPEEVENEKIVELQLQKKQLEVENRLSIVIKKLADLKYTDRLQQSVVCLEKRGTKNNQTRPLTCTTRPIQIKDRTQTSKELQIKEASTRQKLLARREQMRDFGISSPTVSHVMSCQSPVSASSFRSRTSRARFSTTSSMTSRGEENERVSWVQWPPTPPLDKGNIVVKPPRLRSRLGDNSLQMSKAVSNFRSVFLRKTILNRERLSRKGKCVTSRSEGKSSPLVDYITNSRKAMYQNSTFPREIENGIQSDLSGLKRATRKKKQGGSAIGDETSLSKTSDNSCVQLNFSAKAECVSTNLTDKTNGVSKVDIPGRTESQVEPKSTSYENLHLLSPGETATSESGQKVHDQNSLPLICLKKEQEERVKKIRDYVSAAEVIQRTWRLYKRHEHSESNR